MAQLFPKWTNLIPLILIMVIIPAGLGAIGFFWYYGSPEYTDVGYQPVQPVPYSHKLHAGDLGIDCRYCHTGVETGAIATVPTTQTCMNCHNLIKIDSELLKPIRESWETGEPMEWIRVHNLPDYAYFDHSIHTKQGVGCISCHGNIAEMEVVAQEEPLSMGWCLECHRDPNKNLRPTSEITNMKWEMPENHAEFAKIFVKEKNIKPPTNCSGCHR